MASDWADEKAREMLRCVASLSGHECPDRSGRHLVHCVAYYRPAVAAAIREADENASDRRDRLYDSLVADANEARMKAERDLAEAKAHEAAAMKIAIQWQVEADAAQQPPEYYKEYSESTMRAMQALKTKAERERDEARAECGRWEVVAKQAQQIAAKAIAALSGKEKA